MSFSQHLAGFTPDRDTVLTVGVFDGVHLGHRHLLNHLIDWASPGCAPSVLTFSNRPITVFRPGTFPSYLTTPEQKLDLLREAGIELVVPMEFTEELSQVTARQFAELLRENMRMKGLVLGPDSALGRGREGDQAFMKAEGERLGFWVRTVPPLEINGRPVKSRVVREALVAGDVADGARLLGRHHCLNGTVVVGDQRGRTLGFPTANIDVYPGLLWPGDGIYATWAHFGGKRHLSATSIGVRPTFGLTQRLVEVYVMDFSGDLYGQQMTVEFVEKVRNQETFADIDALIARIEKDVEESRTVLSQAESTFPHSASGG
jgi:riboflavin kinase/FMN adenylyltransferase